MVSLEFATAGRIVFGKGAVKQLAVLAPAYGNNALVVTGADAERAKAHLNGLEAGGIACRYFSFSGEPTVAVIREGVQAARYANLIIGFGGGSAIDAAKAIAAVAPNSGEPLDYLEVIGKAKPLDNLPLPWIAIPTTAGTGAEVTRNAVLGSPEHAVKASLRSPFMLAKLAIVDPQLTLGLPPALTAATGLDAITQLIEPFVSSKANVFTDLFCVEGLKRAIGALPRAVANGQDLEAREDMALASLLSGMALANAGLGVVHGIAAPLGGLLNAPHGALCAAVLPHGVATNVAALRARAPQHPALERYRQIARLLNGGDAAEAASSALLDLCLRLKIPALRSYGLTAAQIPAIVEKAQAASSMKSNPLALTAGELAGVVEASL